MSGSAKDGLSHGHKVKQHGHIAARGISWPVHFELSELWSCSTRQSCNQSLQFLENLSESQRKNHGLCRIDLSHPCLYACIFDVVV